MSVIRKAREAARVTQEDLAKRIGIRQPTLSGWERRGCKDYQRRAAMDALGKIVRERAARRQKEAAA